MATRRRQKKSRKTRKQRRNVQPGGMQRARTSTRRGIHIAKEVSKTAAEEHIKEQSKQKLKTILNTIGKSKNNSPFTTVFRTMNPDEYYRLIYGNKMMNKSPDEVVDFEEANREAIKKTTTPHTKTKAINISPEKSGQEYELQTDDMSRLVSSHPSPV